MRLFSAFQRRLVGRSPFAERRDPLPVASPTPTTESLLLSLVLLLPSCASAPTVRGPVASPQPATATSPYGAADEPLLDDALHDHSSAELEPSDVPFREARRQVEEEPFRHPFDDVSRSELESWVKEAPEKLGSLSIGFPHSGRLLNGVQLQASKLFEPVAPGAAYGTQETIDYLTAAVQKVHDRFPDTPPLHVGHLSAKTGGYLSPHLSHQAGRDVDLGFYYSASRKWYARATRANLDVERTWALVRAFVTETDVEMIFIDHSIQHLLKEHALRSGEDPEWVNGLFKSSEGRPALIRHVKGHQTHLHVRFFNPIAQRSAQEVYSLLVEHRLVPPVITYVQHVAKKGDSLNKLARRYGTTVQAIQKANGLKRTVIYAKKTYKIPRQGGPPPVTGKLTFPPRRLPPFDPDDRLTLNQNVSGSPSGNSQK